MGKSGTNAKYSGWQVAMLAVSFFLISPSSFAQQDASSVPAPFIVAATDNLPADRNLPSRYTRTMDAKDRSEAITLAAIDNMPDSEPEHANKVPDGRVDQSRNDALASAAEAISNSCAATLKATHEPNAQRFPISAPLVFGGRYVGDIDLQVDMAGNGDLDAPRLEALMKPILDEPAMDRLRSIRGKMNYVPISEYCDRPIQISFDSGALELHAKAALSALETQAISFKRRTPPNPDDFIAPQKFSAGVGALISQKYTQEGEGDTGFNPLRANFEGYMHFNDWIEGTLFFAADAMEGEDTFFRRREIQFVHDNYEKATRLAIGDINPAIRGFQSSRPLGGISYSKQYNAIQPFRRTVSTGRGQLSLERDSDVEVYVNGVLSERLELRAGNYNLEDFPAAQGLNEVQLRIQDDLGRFIEREFSFFSNSQLLAEGLLDFGFAVGVPRSFSDTGFDYDGSLIASGFVNYGARDSLTLGFNAQARNERLQLGTEAVFGSSIGVFGLEAAASYFDDAPDTLGKYSQFGHAVGVNHRANFSLGNKPIAVNSSAFYQSEFFSGIAEGVPRNQKFVFRSNATASLPNQYRIGATASVTTDHSGQRNARRFALSGSKSFEKFSVNVSANYQSRTSGETETSLLASINVPIGDRNRIRVNTNTQNSLKALEFARSGRGQVGRFDTRIQAIDSDEEQSFNGNMNYWHNRFESRLEFDSRRVRGSDSSDESDLSYRLGTFVGYSDGKIGLGRPSPSGFILIDRHKSIGNNPLKVHDSNGQDIEAHSGLFGAALVPIRRPYLPMQLTLDVDGVAAGYDLGTGKLDVLPRWGAGYHIRVGSDASRMVLGVLRSSGDEPVNLLLGQMQRLDRKDEEIRDFFTNSAGKFVIEGVAPGRYSLRFPDGRSVEIEIDEDTEGLVDVGELEVS